MGEKARSWANKVAVQFSCYTQWTSSDLHANMVGKLSSHVYMMDELTLRAFAAGLYDMHQSSGYRTLRRRLQDSKLRMKEAEVRFLLECGLEGVSRNNRAVRSNSRVLERYPR